MKEKEMKLCIWIHHITTFIGLICGVQALWAEWHSPWKIRKIRFVGILLFLGSQIWAALKIVQDIKAGRSRLRKCVGKMQESIESKQKIRAAITGLLIVSTVYKIFTPYILCRK